MRGGRPRNRAVREGCSHRELKGVVTQKEGKNLAGQGVRK